MAVFDLDSLQEFVRQFDPVEHKYLRYAQSGAGYDLRRALERELPPWQDESWTLDEIEDTYQTLQKVYGEREREFCQIIELASERFLGDYVGIEGIRQLFRSSYFYFEWMMHLEYSKSRHDYTYYRDHYVHQVKNMYEMFTLLDTLDYEGLCRRLYQSMDNKVGELLRNSVWEERNRCTKEWSAAWKLMKKTSPEEQEQMLYGYLFHVAAVISSLLHDIGYPIAYIGRTVRELGDFVPFSHLFVQEVETISTIHSVLQDSLLYKVAGQKEVARRVGEKDHGALSAVILLYKYYDNGKIAMLSPVKKAAIELAALMIYNHTLKYRNLGKKSDCYKSLFQENPMSYLFRLCDDMQEWNRVYFDISTKSNFFVCGDCYMPMIRSQDESNVHEKNYSCWCGDKKGRNTTMFAYRRLINVDACRCVEVDREDAGQIIRIVYDKGRLLQTAAYDASFALKRSEGAWEIKKMLDRQPEFPKTFLDFFLSNNPMLLKAEILEEWLKKHRDKFNQIIVIEKLATELREVMEKSGPEGMAEKAEFYMQVGSELETLWNEVRESLRTELEEGAAWEKGKSNKAIAYMWEKTYFYFCLAFIGELMQQIDKKIWCGRGGSQTLKDAMGRLEDVICRRFDIVHGDERALISQALYQKARQFNWDQYREICSEEERDLYFSVFQHNHYDMDLASRYIMDETYEDIKRAAWETKDTEGAVPVRYDYYSDFYLYYTIAELTRGRCRSSYADAVK